MDHLTCVPNQLNGASPEVAARFFELVYEELHELAQRSMQRESPGHTLQPTALVHEAYLRLVDANDCTWQNRRHFLAVAAVTLRRVLVEHARRRGRFKRGGNVQRVALDEARDCAAFSDGRLLALDDALRRLERVDEEKARIVELRFFGGLTVDEAAAVLEISPSTVARGWRLARAWLRTEISQNALDRSSEEGSADEARRMAIG
ncbi:MAG: ECF-type sigma factor [Planctomycetota bacterium]|jgi:RNA polymerase sigma factor (TIGR02999 family)